MTVAIHSHTEESRQREHIVEFGRSLFGGWLVAHTNQCQSGPA